MAIRHGKAGQYGKGEALRHTRAIILRLLTFTAIFCATTGWIIGFFSKPGLSVTGCVVLVVVAVAGYGYWKYKGEPQLDTTAKERLKYLRGGQCEGFVAWLLQDAGNDSWHLFNGIKLEQDSDIDHILVGPGGLYCISTKSHRGLFCGTPDGLLHNNEPSNFANAVMRQAMTLKDRLTVAMGKDVPWITPVLAVPFGYTEADALGGKVWLVHQENIADRLVPEDGPKKLSRDQITRIVKVLEMIEADAATIYRRSDPARQA